MSIKAIYYIKEGIESYWRKVKVNLTPILLSVLIIVRKQIA